MKSKKLIVWGVVAVLIAIFLYWVYKESSKPLPGQKIEDLGRGHVDVGKEIEYNSNPPTSGPHYADWVRAGIYEIPQDDRYLVHSLEHGYIIMSYNCDKQVTSDKGRVISQVNAQEMESGGEATTSGEAATDSAQLSENFKSDQCKSLVEQLTLIFNSKDKKKLIVIPRPNLDSRVALTAWTYLDKFDSFDAERINKFIDVHRDHGPEKTME